MSSRYPKSWHLQSCVWGWWGHSVVWTGSINAVNMSRTCLCRWSNVWQQASHWLLSLWSRTEWIRMKAGHFLKRQPVSQRVPMNPGGQMQSPLPSWHTPPFKHSGQSLLQSWPHFLLAQAASKNTLVYRVQTSFFVSWRWNHNQNQKHNFLHWGGICCGEVGALEDISRAATTLKISSNYLEGCQIYSIYSLFKLLWVTSLSKTKPRLVVQMHLVVLCIYVDDLLMVRSKSSTPSLHETYSKYGNVPALVERGQLES